MADDIKNSNPENKVPKQLETKCPKGFFVNRYVRCKGGYPGSISLCAKTNSFLIDSIILGEG